MKKAYITLLTILGLSSFSMAGGSSYASKAPVDKTPPPPPPPVGCDCFNPGGQFSLYGAALLGSDDLDESGGIGLSVAQFFTPNVGIEVDATWAFADSTLHMFSGSLVLRAPITSACVAPYVFGGGGYEVDSVKQGTVHVGAGIDVRLQDCFGIFADARYTFADKTDDWVLIRAGVRMNF